MNRPASIYIDRRRCLGSGICGLLAPLGTTGADALPVDEETLAAMASCPSGALVWQEEIEEEEGAPGSGEGPGVAE